MPILMSLAGMTVLGALAMLLSNNRNEINYRTIGPAFSVQATMASMGVMCSSSTMT